MLSLFSTTVNAQDMKQTDRIDISDILSYDEFQEIKKFILDKGVTKEKAPFADSPYYRFSDVDVYLMSYNEKEQENGKAYNTLLFEISPESNDISYMYTLVKEDLTKETVYLSSYWDTKEEMTDRRVKIAQYLESILKESRYKPNTIYHHTRRVNN